jgi:hypothetical protein
MKSHFLFSDTEIKCTKVEVSKSWFGLNFTLIYFSFIITALYDESHIILLLQYLEKSV